MMSKGSTHCSIGAATCKAAIITDLPIHPKCLGRFRNRREGLMPGNDVRVIIKV